MNHCKIILILFLLGWTTTTHAVDSSVDVHLEVEVACNYNGMCESGKGETAFSCRDDCASSPSSIGGMGIGYSYVKNLVVKPEMNHVTLLWESDISMKTTVRWGTTAELTDGAINGTLFLREHTAQIYNLIPGVTYFFSIQSSNVYGVVHTSPVTAFTTLSLLIITLPSNPSNFYHTTSDTAVLLSWKNPQDKDFAYVRIVRSEDRYHASPYSGVLVYEGVAENVVDSFVDPGKKYFYVMYARNTRGKYSSGVGLSVVFRGKDSALSNGGFLIPDLPFPPIFSIPITQYKELFPYYRFIQNEKDVHYMKSVVPLAAFSPIAIETAFETFKGVEDAYITIVAPSGLLHGPYFFLYDTDRNTYHSSIPSLTEAGYHTFVISGYNRRGILTLNKGVFDVHTPLNSIAVQNDHAHYYSSEEWMIIILFLILLFYFLRKKERDRE